MLVELDWGGASWTLDTEEITLAQAFVIKDTTKDESWPSGRPLQPFLAGISSGDPGCVRALYWLMLQQNGHSTVITQVPADFPVWKFHSAYSLAAQGAAQDPETLRQIIAEAEKALEPMRKALAIADAKEAAQAQEAAGPTPPPGTAPAASGEPSSPKKHATTAAAGG